MQQPGNGVSAYFDGTLFGSNYSNFGSSPFPNGTCVELNTASGMWLAVPCIQMLLPCCTSAAAACSPATAAVLTHVSAILPHVAGGATVQVSRSDPGSLSAGQLLLDNVYVDVFATPAFAEFAPSPFTDMTPLASGIYGSAQLTSLDAGTLYCTWVSNYAGGVSGGMEFWTGPLTAPGTPTIRECINTTGGATVVVVSPPYDDGGSPVLSFTLQVTSVIAYPWSWVSPSNILFNISAPAGNLITYAMETGSGGGGGGSFGTLPSSSVYYFSGEGFQIGGLTAGTTFYFRVSAVNSVGVSQWSYPFTKMTMAATMPSPPLNVTAIAITGGSVTLSWSAPFDTGGVDIVSYVVYVNGTKFLSSTNQYRAAGLQGAATYVFAV